MKRSCLYLLFLVPVAVFILPTWAFADDSDEKTSYAEFRIGSYYPHSMHSPDLNYGICSELALGEYILPFLSLEGSLGYMNTDGEDSFKMNMYPLALTLRLGFMGGLYLLAGGGMYYTDTEMRVNQSIEKKDTWNPGAHAGIGVNFNLGSKMYLGAQWRYLWLKADGPQNIKLDLKGNAATATIGFRF